MSSRTVKLKKEMTVCVNCVAKHSVSVYRTVKMGNCAICGGGQGTFPRFCKVVDKDQSIKVLDEVEA